jgi:hypothetical protein
MVYVCLKWSTCVYNGLGQNLVLFVIFPVLYRECCGFCVGVVRTLFGLSPGMFGCTQEKSEQSPNKVNSKTGGNPEGDEVLALSFLSWLIVLICLYEIKY